MFGFKIKKSLIFLGVVLALLIFVHYIKLFSPVEYGLRSFFIPISNKVNKWRINIGNTLFSLDRQLVMDSYNQCLAKNQKLEISEAQLKIFERENEELRKQLQFSHAHNFIMAVADVIGKNMDSLEKTTIINAGEDAQVKAGQPVIAGGGILVGTITKVEKNISTVRLISDNRSKIGATILNRDGSLGVVEGGYGLSIKMNFIPRNEVVLIGDKIITSGLEQDIPRGLLIGEVAVAEAEAYQPFQQAILTPAVDLSKLTIVNVITAIKK